MPQHTHEHDGLPPHDPDTVHDRGTVVDRDMVDDRDVVVDDRPATARAAVTVAPAPGGVATRIALTILGAAAMIIGAFLAWLSGGGPKGVDIEFKVFYSVEAGGESGFIASAGFILIILGLVALLGLAFRVGWLTSLAGALGLLAIVLYTVSVYRADLGIGDLGIGAWICAVGSLVTLVAGWFGGRDRVVATSP